MEIRLLEIAGIELEEAIDYYNYELHGLGEVFLTEFLSAINRIVKQPMAWHPYSKRTRRCRLRKFPYGIIYQTRDTEILIVAVANLHRNPDRWSNRI